jgi:hypothetical protein
MNKEEVTESINNILENKSDEVKNTINEILEKLLEESARGDAPAVDSTPPTLPSTIPEPSLRTKHILKIQSDLADAEDALSWLVAFYKTGNQAKFQYYSDCFLEFVNNNLTKEDAAYIMRKALTDHSLPMIPGRLFNFNEFHKRFGAYIRSDEFKEKIRK